MKRFRNKETTVISVIKKKKRRVKLKLKHTKGTLIIKNLSFKVSVSKKALFAHTRFHENPSVGTEVIMGRQICF
jgi:hypothetical protein